MSDDIKRARAVLVENAPATWEEMTDLAERLKTTRQFGYARRLFARARIDSGPPAQSASIKLRLAQQHALCTYRDLDLPVAQRFADALAILHQADLSSEYPEAETLGLAGAIFKNQWKYGGLRRDLEQSLTYYARGAAYGVARDLGYCAINAAYMLDALAHAQSAVAPTFAIERAQEARSLRRKISAELPAAAVGERLSDPEKAWWFYATLTESAFGLGNYTEACRWLSAGVAVKPKEWQLESLIRQLVALTVAQGQSLGADSEAFSVFRVAVGDAATSVGALAFGKVGLALSGGGFRASLFHIGVLARMAELDVLRHIEVLSCVSGGSIIGACYYLEVRHLLNTKHDAEVTREDYIDIVRRVADNFTAGIRKNLRTRLFVAWLANLRTLFQPAYTRTTLLGDFFERYLYSGAADAHQGPRWLNELVVRPPGEAEDFNPQDSNWRRAAKVPILLLNATTLNTGHNWQFAVTWMGEPPLGASSAVDSNDIFRRMYYWEAPAQHRRVRLGLAVAASACVPALFDPIELNGLFPSASLQLVDGGVHDNQGTSGLIEQECNVMIVSDASGQANTASRPSGESPAVALRSNDILMGRVREAEFRELDLMNRSSALAGLAFLHLKKDLQALQLDWIGCEDPYVAGQGAPAGEPASGVPQTDTYYGIPRAIQARLAGLRTDLDSFSDMEAQALMLSGYRMASVDLATNLTQWPTAGQHYPWKFLEVADTVAGSPGFEEDQAQLLKVLSAGAFRGFKIWRLQPQICIAVTVVLLAILVGAIWGLRLVWRPSWQSLINWGLVALGGVLCVGGLLWAVPRLFGVRKSLTVIVTGAVLISVGWLVAWLHIGLFDAIFQRLGRVRARGLR
jgi:predicted acylesterase/phospholipase RssA